MTEILSKIESAVILQFVKDCRPTLAVKCGEFEFSIEGAAYQIVENHIVAADFPQNFRATRVDVEFSRAGCTFSFSSQKKSLRGKVALPLSDEIKKTWTPAAEACLDSIFVSICGEKNAELKCAVPIDFNSDKAIFSRAELDWARVRNVKTPAVVALSEEGAVAVFQLDFACDDAVTVKFSTGFLRFSFSARLQKTTPFVDCGRKLVFYKTTEIAPETERFLREKLDAVLKNG